MIFIGMLVGFFVGMYIAQSIIGYTFFGVAGIWIGALLETFFSSNRSDTWLVDRKEALRLSLVFLCSLVVLFIADAIFTNKLIVLVIHLASLVIFDSWKRVIKGAISWKQLACIGGGCFIGIFLSALLWLPSWISFFCPLAGAIGGDALYSRFFHARIKDERRELYYLIVFYGILAGIEDGTASAEEEEYFASRFLNPDPNAADWNQAVANIFCSVAANTQNWKQSVAEYVRVALLNQSPAINNDLIDLCYFSLLKGHGEMSESKREVLVFFANELNYPIRFLDQIIENLKNHLAGQANSYCSQTQNFSSITDYFAVLGCDQNASCEEVNNAYRLQCKLNHPDLMLSYGFDEKAVEEATTKMKIINEAYAKIKEYKNWR